jgi:hypothetical protein
MTGTMSAEALSELFSQQSSLGNHTLDDQIRPEDTHGADTDTGLGGTVRGTEAGEDDGCGAAHGTEEGLVTRHVSAP